MFLSRFPFRLIRQGWTKSYSTVSVKEVEALKKKTFYSVHTRNNMSAPGFPLSSARLSVSKVLKIIWNDVNGDENVKNSWIHKQNNFPRVSRFFVHFFPVFARLRRDSKCLILRFMDGVYKQIPNFISLSELGYGPLKFSFRRVRLHLTSRWVRIIAIMTERTQIHFLSYVLVAVASLDFKIPNVELYMKRT